MKQCTQCGTLITTDSPGGLCPRCMLSVAMKSRNSGSPNSVETQAAEKGASGAAPAMIDIANAAEIARRLPQFEIMELLGRGGMGVVYKARQIQLDRIVALKILPPADALSPGFVERFRREARSLAKLSHTNIVSVYDFGEASGLYYFVMEFVDGLNLRQMIHAKRMTPAEALAVVPPICDALQFAHEEGVVHRDIKPENILIDKKGRVKIADFGLAKLLGRAETDPRLTVSGATLGTPRYMAPEQVDKPESVDHRADIYSLGVVFYEMLTGELPMGRFAPPSQKVQIDVRLDEIVLHALERDVELRYQHASEVKSDLATVAGTGKGDEAEGKSRAQVSARTALFTDLIHTVFWTGIIGFAMFKLRSAWPLAALFFSGWTDSEIENEDVERWSKLFGFMCIVSLCGYGMWIVNSFWPIAGLVFLFDWAAFFKTQRALKARARKESPELQTLAPANEPQPAVQNGARLAESPAEMVRPPSAEPPTAAPVAEYARQSSSLASSQHSRIRAGVTFHAVAFGAFSLCWLLTAAAWNFGPWGILAAAGAMTLVVGLLCRKMLKSRPELVAARSRGLIRSRIQTIFSALSFLLGFVCLMIGVAASWDAQRASPDTVECAELFEKGRIGKADGQMIKLSRSQFATLDNISPGDLALEARRNFTPSMKSVAFDPGDPDGPLLTPHSLYPFGSSPAGTNGLLYNLRFAFWPVAFPPQYLHGSPGRYSYPMMLALGAVVVLLSIVGWNAARGYKCSWTLLWRPGLTLALLVFLSLGMVYFVPTVIQGLGFVPQPKWSYMVNCMGMTTSNVPHDLIVSEADRWAGDHGYSIAAETVADIKDSRGFVPANTFVTYTALSLWDPNVFHRWHMTWHGPRLDRPEIFLRHAGDEHGSHLEYVMPQMLTETEARAASQPFNFFAYVDRYSHKQDRFGSLGAKARAELAAGHDDKAAALAQEWLAMAPEFRDGWEHGNAIHDGNEILGLIALRKNDVAEAKSRLLAAGQTRGSPEIFASGPDLRLADALLARGERQAVLDYLEQFQFKWNKGFERLRQPIEALRAGKTPKLATTQPASTQHSTSQP